MPPPEESLLMPPPGEGGRGVGTSSKSQRFSPKPFFEIPQTDNYTATVSGKYIRATIEIIAFLVIQDVAALFNLSLLKSSPRPISIGQLNTLPCLHLRPINLVVFKGSYSFDGIPYLEVSFTLRCFQRLSAPHFATLPCRWRDNRCTIGAFIPVLSY